MVPDAVAMSTHGPFCVPVLASDAPEEPPPEGDPPPDPDEVDDPDASEPAGLPLEEGALPEDVDPLDPGPPPELEPDPASFGVSTAPPVPPTGPQATPLKRKAAERK
jgi:hypothetical protein